MGGRTWSSSDTVQPQSTNSSSQALGSQISSCHEDHAYFDCPFYINFKKNKTTSVVMSEGQLICRVPIRTKFHPPNYWAQRSVCLLCYSDNIQET